MFEVLISSRAPHQWSPGKGLLVAALHGVVLAGAIDLSDAPASAPPGPAVDTTPFTLDAPPPVAAPPAAPEFSVPGAPSVDLPPVPVDVPVSLPPVSLGPVLDPEVVRRAIRSGPPGPVAGGPPRAEYIPGAQEVEEPAGVVHQPSPRYPPALSIAGVEGRVLVEFVIDTTGHVEDRTLRVVESSHRGFEGAALETLSRSLFRPARNGGRTVRQRVVQSIVFRLER